MAAENLSELRARELHARIDREVDKLEDRVDGVEAKVEKVLFALVAFSLSLAGTTIFYIVQLKGGRP